MKKFSFKYSALVWILLFAVLILSIIGIGWNIYNIISYIYQNATNVIIYSFTIVLIIILLIIDLSVIFYGKYVIKGKELYTCFGILKDKIDIFEISEIDLFKKSDKLVLYNKENKFTVIMISPDKYEEFILSLREINKEIIYDIKYEEDTLKN